MSLISKAFAPDSIFGRDTLRAFMRAHERSKLKRAVINFYLFIATAAIGSIGHGLWPNNGRGSASNLLLPDLSAASPETRTCSRRGLNNRASV